MAKQRIVNTRFWTDTYIAALDPIEKLLFLYLLTNQYTDICGVYELPLRNMAVDSGIEKEMVERILRRFESDGKIVYKNGWVIIKNFAKYQAKNPKVDLGVKYGISRLPEEIKIVYDSLSHPNLNSNPNLNPNSKGDVHTLWISTYGQNPDPVKQKFGQTLIDKFGYDKARQILWTLNKNNFHSVAKMESVISETGEVILDKPGTPAKRPEMIMNDEHKKIRMKLMENKIGS